MENYKNSLSEDLATVKGELMKVAKLYLELQAKNVIEETYKKDIQQLYNESIGDIAKVYSRETSRFKVSPETEAVLLRELNTVYEILQVFQT